MSSFSFVERLSHSSLASFNKVKYDLPLSKLQPLTVKEVEPIKTWNAISIIARYLIPVYRTVTSVIRLFQIQVYSRFHERR